MCRERTETKRGETATCKEGRKDKYKKKKETESCPKRERRVRQTHIFTADVDLVHAVCHWDHQLDAKLLVRHVDIWHHLAAWHRSAGSCEKRNMWLQHNNTQPNIASQLGTVKQAIM